MNKIMPKCVKKIFLLLLLLFSCFPEYGHSTTIEQVFTNNWSTENSSAGWSYQGFKLFDTSLGNLNEVRIIISSTLLGDTHGDGINVRSNFYTSLAPVNWLFYTQNVSYNIGTVTETAYSIKQDGTITGILPSDNTWLQQIDFWTGDDALLPAFYQDSDGPAHTFNSTTRLAYEYTPVPEPATLLLLGPCIFVLLAFKKRWVFV
jgi:hypothetical protein